MVNGKQPVMEPNRTGIRKQQPHADQGLNVCLGLLGEAGMFLNFGSLRVITGSQKKAYCPYYDATFLLALSRVSSSQELVTVRLRWISVNKIFCYCH